jgi:Rne/Rng family ribonuclease
MAKEICISSTPHETRLAILEDDQLAEIYYERENEYTLAGSIYNGRVTRVLPGMQSAFVDLGLERDAFLYVTDFVELEDQEDTEELERAASSGAAQPPREVRRSSDQAPRSGRERQRPERGVEERQERSAESAAPEMTASASGSEEAPIVPELEQASQEGGGQGGRRWRGRRHRRGRGQGGAAESRGASHGQPVGEAAPELDSEEEEVVSEIEAAEAFEEAPTARAVHAPAPFVLPGESLSKYGGTPVAETAKPAATAPAPVVRSSKPSTLVEAPLDWDGTGLLPGESLSGRRARQNEQEAAASPDLSHDSSHDSGHDSSAEAATGTAAADQQEVIEEELATPAEESEPPSLHEIEAAPEERTVAYSADQLVADSIAPRSEEEPADEDGPSGAELLPCAASGETGDVAEAEHVREEEIKEEEIEGNTSASHRIDPASPSGFRFFGLGGKKKKDDEPASAEVEVVAAPVEEHAPAVSAPVVSAYAPGVGLVEEELIEGEELEAAPHRRGVDEHDLDDYEEETLSTQIRSGALGEMLQEAQLDHKIQLEFEEGNGEVEEDEEEEEEASAGAPAAAAGLPRRDRDGRGRRGRQQGNRRGPSRRSAQTSDLPVISELLKPGQEILVQIAKEPIAKKGARITSHIALPGRFLVFMPTVTHVGVSRKIASDEERHRLKRILINERGDAAGGFIVRTAAEGASEEELRADLRFLMNLWNDIKQRSDSSKSPALIYHDLSLIERILRDQVSENFSNIWVDSEADYERIVRFLNRFSPTLVRRVKLYTKETPLFEHFGIQDEISKALRSKVWLKSGGSIVINQTEALVAIDINTGKYVGKSARLEDTILKTNLDAVPEIVRQIRLRDLGGIIVIDFIDMDERKNRFKVMAALEEALKSDRAPTKVLQFNDFGLVAITRKRVKQSLERTLSVPCPICQATGMVKSPSTVCNEIYVELRKMRKHFEGADVLLRVNPETVKILKSNNARWLTEFEDLVGKNILVKSDATLHPEQFDIQG